MWACGLVVVAAVAMGVLGALHTGISWDEPYHVMRLRNYFDHGWFALDWTVDGSSATGGDSNTLVYGPIAMLLLHGWSVLWGAEGWDSVATTPYAYDVRHLGVVLIGLVGTGAAAATTRILLDSWRWALVTVATLLALPMWTGHLMFNVKDVPVATGYMLMTLALVAMMEPGRVRRPLRIAGLVGGIVLMVGTRPAMASAVLVGLVVLALGARAAGRTRAVLSEAAPGAIAGVGMLIAIYPRLFLHPGNLLHSAEQSSSFRGGQSANYGYVAFHVLAQTPLLLLAFFVVGLVSAIGFVRQRWRTDATHTTRLALVCVQLVVLPLVAIAKHSDLYNGLRQLLFAAPAWAVLTTVGLARVLVWARAHGRLRLVGGLAVVALAAPMVDQAALFPYQYTYFNVALDATGVHVPSDYWRTSVPELLHRIPTDGQVVCAPTRSSTLGAVAGSPEAAGIDEATMVAGRYSSDSSVDCRTDPLGPLAPLWMQHGLSYADRLPRDEFYAIIDRDHPVPRNCARLAEVTRNRHGRDLAMTYVARCHLEASTLGTTPVDFIRLPDEIMPSRQWAYAPEGWVMRESSTAIDATGPSASLTFNAAESCAGHPCALDLDASAPSDLQVSVNDRSVVSTVTDGSVVVELPPGVAGAWVTFSRTTGEPLDLRVHSLRVTPTDQSGVPR